MPNVHAQEVKTWQDAFNSNVTKAEAIRQKYQGKAEGMSGQEETEYVNLINEADALKSKIETGKKALACTAFAKSAKSAGLPMGGSPGEGADSGEAEVKAYNKAHLKAFREYLRGERKSVTELAMTNPAVKAFNALEVPNDPELKTYLKNSSMKAYQSDNPGGFGFAVPPQELVQQIITLMKDLTFMRGLATKFQVPTAESLGVPAIDTDPSDSDWTEELAVGNEETTMATGKREFKPSPLAKYIKESKKLLRQVPNVESIILDRLSYKMAITQEKAFLSGTGANQPLGVFVASATGIPTSRDTTAAGASAIAADDLIAVFYNLKAQYRQRAAWILNRTVVLAIRKLKDSNNNYLWTTAIPGSAYAPTGPGGGLQGTPELLMGRPIHESEYAPGTITTGLYTAVLGDFSHYWIADALDMQVQVLYELFALTNQLGIVLRTECDAMPVLAESFARLRQA